MNLRTIFSLPFHQISVVGQKVEKDLEVGHILFGMDLGHVLKAEDLGHIFFPVAFSFAFLDGLLQQSADLEQISTKQTLPGNKESGFDTEGIKKDLQKK